MGQMNTQNCIVCEYEIVAMHCSVTPIITIIKSDFNRDSDSEFRQNEWRKTIHNTEI